MRILLLHNRYQQAGGEDVVVAAERDLLAAHGHPVALVEADNDDLVGVAGLARAGLGAVYSRSARRWIEAEIARFRPDVVHVHNFFPLLSPSVYDACRALGVPVVQTLHNYRLTCPNAILYRAGKVCEDCLGKPLPWPGVMRGCYRDSRVQSAVVAAMIAGHRLRGTWRERVDAFIALTSFQRDLLLKAGLPPEKLHVKPNFTFEPGPRRIDAAPEAFALFVGRLSEEKGLSTVIEAYQRHGIQVPLWIVGDGPMRPFLEAHAAGLNQVLFLGRRPHEDVLEFMRQARFLVFPSNWYETFGLAIIEAFSVGLPVVASRLGAIPELLAGGERGWLVDPDDPAAWATALKTADEDHAGRARRAVAAREAFERHFGPEENYRLLLDIYRSVDRAAQSPLAPAAP